MAIVKRLVDVYKTFVLGDPRYILNDLYITDMILWAQSSDLTERKVQKMANGLEAAVVEAVKSNVGLNLDEWERVGKISMEEEIEESGKEQIEEDEEESSSEDGNSELSTSEEEDASETSELDSDDDEVDDIVAVTEKFKQISC